MAKEEKELGAYGFHKKGAASGGGFVKGKFVHSNASHPKSKALKKAHM